MQLEVIIVGAGLAGLAAANGLRRAGHRVRVFEKSSFTRDLGAGITVTPNGSRILRKWGFNFEKARATVAREIRMLDGETLETMMSTPLNSGKEMDSFQLYRPDYHAELMRMATSEDGDGQPVIVTLGAEVIGADAESGVIHLADGTTYSGDLIIGSDGVHSKLQAIVSPGKPAIMHTGYGSYRFMADTKDLLQDLQTKDLYESHKDCWKCVSVQSMKWFLIWYDVRGNDLQNFAFCYPSEDLPLTNKGSTQEELKKSLLEDCKQFHTNMRQVMSKAQDIKPWEVKIHEPLSTWTKGKIVLLGDSAHPMYPIYTQGVNTSVEDAATLQVLLGDVKDMPDLNRKIRAFEEIRLPRTAIIQYLSALTFKLSQEFVDRVQPYLKEYPPIVTRADYNNFIWSYDTFARAEEKIQSITSLN